MNIPAMSTSANPRCPKCARPRAASAILALLAASPLPAAQVVDAPVFDSYTPPASYSGYSSPNAGLASRISVTQDTQLAAFAVNNQMLASGNLKFLILGEPSRNILYQSPPVAFGAESTFSWKSSPSLSFLLTAGQQYWIGYVRSVGVNDRGDTVRESANGISSLGQTASISGYASPVFSHVVFLGEDSAVRLYAVPEPAAAFPCLAGLLAQSIVRRRRRHG